MARRVCPTCSARQDVDDGVAYYQCRKCDGTNYLIVHQCGATVPVPADERGRVAPLWECPNCGQVMKVGGGRAGAGLERVGQGMQALGKTIQGIVGAALLLVLIYFAAQCAGVFGEEDPEVAACEAEAERLSNVRQRNAARTADTDAEYDRMVDRIIQMYQDELAACATLQD